MIKKIIFQNILIILQDKNVKYSYDKNKNILLIKQKYYIYINKKIIL